MNKNYTGLYKITYSPNNIDSYVIATSYNNALEMANTDESSISSVELVQNYIITSNKAATILLGQMQNLQPF